MERRVQETEKVGNIYRDLLASLPTDLENFKTVLSKTKDETIVELQNQNETIKRKLHSAEELIQHSGNSKEVITLHLRVLNNLLSKRANQFGRRGELDLASICEFGERKVENCIGYLVSAKTIDEFLHAIGFSVHVTTDDSFVKVAFTERKAPDGKPLEFATASHSIDTGWYCAANEHFYVSPERLSHLKDEFSYVKTVA